MSRLGDSAARSTPARSRSTSSAGASAGTSSRGVIVLVARRGTGRSAASTSASSSRAASSSRPRSRPTRPRRKVETITDAVVGTEIEAAQTPVVVDVRHRRDPRPDRAADTDETSRSSRRAIEAAGADRGQPSSIGPTWGRQVAKKALTGLIVFLVLVVLFIWAYFREWRMSVAAIVALAHDLIITVGVYALAGFEVTPATVTGLLTILGYSLYDTVVVFDKVRENTKGITTSTSPTYAERANLAVNQTLVRSINTSIAALLPVGAILYVGVVPARHRPAQGPGAGAVRRHGGGHVLVDLHRDAAAGAAQEARAGDGRAGQAGAARGATPGARGRAGDRAVPRPRPAPSLATDRRRTPRRADGRPAATATRRRRPGRRARSRPAVAADEQQRASKRAQPQRQARVEARQALMTGRGTPGRRGSTLAWSATCPTSPSRASSSRTSRRCWPTTTAFAQVVDALAAAGRDDAGGVVVDKVVGIEARGFILAAPVALALGAASCRSARPASCPARRTRRVLRPGVRRGDPRDPPRRPGSRATGCSWSTTCSPPAAPLRRHREPDRAGRCADGRGRRRADRARLPARPATAGRPAHRRSVDGLTVLPTVDDSDGAHLGVPVALAAA